MQTIDLVNGVWDAASNAVVGRLTPQPYDRRIVLAAVIGPANTTLTIFRGFALINAYAISTVFPADNRTYDSIMDQAPMVIFGSEIATFAWTGGSAGSGQTATATVRSEWG